MSSIPRGLYNSRDEDDTNSKALANGATRETRRQGAAPRNANLRHQSKRRVRHVKTGRKETWRGISSFNAAALAAWTTFGIALASQARAEPTWQSDPTLIPQLAAQTGKGVVLYFETAHSEDCARINESTWPGLPSVIADEQFLWLRLNPQDNQSFFSHYEIMTVPEIVLLDSRFGEQFRLKGFVEADTLRVILRDIPRGRPVLATTGAGQNVGISAPGSATSGSGESTEGIEKGQNFYTENFDRFSGIDAMRSHLFEFIPRAACRIDPSGGMGASPGFVVDSGSSEAGRLRMDISFGLARVDQVIGRMRVGARFRALELDKEVQGVAVVTIVPSGGDPDAPEARRETMYLAERHFAWTAREVTTPDINFRSDKVFLSLQVAGPARSFVVDDIVVELLPASHPGQPQVALGEGPPKTGGPDPLSFLDRTAEQGEFGRWDADGNGIVERHEMPAEMVGLFEIFDLDENGTVTFTEFETASPDIAKRAMELTRRRRNQREKK